MIDFASFHFLRPLWFIALIPLSAVLLLLVFKHIGSRSWEAVCDAGLLPFILIKGAGRSGQGFTIATTLAGLLAILALAGPVWEKLPQPVFATQNALIIGLDLSRSMDADDVSPSRLGRARFKIRDILDERFEGQTALLVYAGDAFTVTPLTDDTHTIQSQLNALETGIMPAPGNRTHIAINQSVALLKQAGMSQGDVLLITDEVSFTGSENAARALRKQGYRLSILGAGTEHGVPVPLADGSFLKGDDGAIIIPVLDEGPMEELAATGGGIYLRLSKDDQDVQALTRYFATQGELGEDIATELETQIWREQGPWLVLCLLPLAALLFRRGYVCLLLVLILPPAMPVYAFDWDSLWSRKDQQAQRAMGDGDYEKAAELFDEPTWKAAAQHRSKQYASAVQTLNGLDDTQSLYNKGNALARMGKYRQAIAAYDQALALTPEHDDAKFNRALLEKEMEQQQQEQQQDQSDQSQINNSNQIRANNKNSDNNSQNRNNNKSNNRQSRNNNGNNRQSRNNNSNQIRANNKNNNKINSRKNSDNNSLSKANNSHKNSDNNKPNRSNRTMNANPLHNVESRTQMRRNRPLSNYYVAFQMIRPLCSDASFAINTNNAVMTPVKAKSAGRTCRD